MSTQLCEPRLPGGPRGASSLAASHAIAKEFGWTDPASTLEAGSDTNKRHSLHKPAQPNGWTCSKELRFRRFSSCPNSLNGDQMTWTALSILVKFPVGNQFL